MTPPHTAAEILHGLELTWRFITDCLMRGSPTDAIPEEDAINHSDDLGSP